MIDIVERVIDNTAPSSSYKDLGVLYFAREFFANCKEYPQAPMHYEMMKHALELLHPDKQSRMERQMYNLVHREGAKTTHFSFILPMYLLSLTGQTIYVRFDNVGWEGSDLHQFDILPIEINQEFIVIASETLARSEMFCVNIKSELSSNRHLINVFGDKTPRVIDDPYAEQTWRKTNFITADGSILMGVGMNQQIRGINQLGKRPTLVIADDIYSGKSVVTEESRQKTREKFFMELIPALDSKKGKAILVGTLVHEDTVLYDVMHSDSWYGFQYPIINQPELQKVLNLCVLDYDNASMKLPSKELIGGLNDELKSISWRERQSLEYILQMYKEKFELRKLSYFYQEYLHILRSPDDEAFTDQLVEFVDFNFTREYDSLWVECKYNGNRWKGLCSLTLGVDIAASESAKSDDTAIIVGGYAHLYPQIDGYDGMAAQGLHDSKPKGMLFPLCVDGYVGKTDIYDNEKVFGSQKVMKRGIINLVEYYARLYKIERIVVETSAQQALIARELRRHILGLREQSPAFARVKIIEEKPTAQQGKKQERITNTLLPIMQGNHKTFFGKNRVCSQVWQQLKMLGVAEHDDAADGYAYSMLHALKPQKIDYQIGQPDLMYQTNDKIEIPDWRLI